MRRESDSWETHISGNTEPEVRAPLTDGVPRIVWGPFENRPLGLPHIVCQDGFTVLTSA